MVPDPRRILEAASEQRAACEVLPRGGAWMPATVVRVERGGVVVRMPGAVPDGSDVRVWVTVDGVPWTFEASVLRTAVPVPDRSQHGVLLGFLDHFRRAGSRDAAVVLDVIPPNGGPVSLVQGAVRVVDLSPEEWTITAPRDFPIVFVAHGEVRLRVGLPDRAPMELTARVTALRPVDGHLLYALHIARVEDPARYRTLLAGIRAALGT